MHEIPSPGSAVALAGATLEPFFERLSCHAEIGDPCRAALAEAISLPRRLDIGASTSHEGEDVAAFTVICQGLVLCSRKLSNGSQQNLAIRAPGQVLDQAGFILGRAGVSARSLTRSLLVSITRPALSTILERTPALGEALATDVIVAQEWMVSIGRRSAYSRIAHFLCEVVIRLEEVGMTSPSGCHFPLTQSDLADTVGLSVIHTNRVLHQLRGEGLISFRRGRLEVRDWSGLMNAGNFDVAYLRTAARS